MAFQPVPNAAKVAIEGELHGEAAVVTMGFLGNVGWESNILQGLADDISLWWRTEALDQLPGDYTFRQVVAKGLRSASDFEASNSTNSGSFGTLIGQCLPGNCTLAISFRTGSTGRSRRGRIYWPGLLESAVTNNQIASLQISAIVGVFDSLLGGGITGPNWIWSVISRRQNGVQLANGVCYPITAVGVTDPFVDSQRRRLPRRGI